MPDADILLKKGQRGLIVGQTGSGKTWGAIWHMQNVSVTPIVIFDTKGEPEFDKIALHDETIEFYDDMHSFAKEWKAKKRQPTYSIVRPSAVEVSEPFEMDAYLHDILNKKRSCFLYFDELYQWHNNSRAGPGLTGLLTRGRSAGITVLMGSQRPAWLSRFALTESQKFYIYKLSHKDDHRRLGDVIPDFEDAEKIAKKFEWVYYNSSNDSLSRFSPVSISRNEEPVENTNIYTREWL